MLQFGLMSHLPIYVIKIGTNTLTTPDASLDLNVMRHLVGQICDELDHKRASVVLVTSGAITCGAEAMQIRPTAIPERQAAASVGQILLMQEYGRFFSARGYMIGQILLTKDCLIDDCRKQNTTTTIFTLLAHGIVPIINENDSVATDEIGVKFGDNDELSSGVAQLVGARQLILLTDIEGLYTANPKTSDSAALIPVIEAVTDEVLALVQDVDNGRSRGGMLSKLNSAKQANEAGVSVVLANGRREDVIRDVLAGRSVGTRVGKVG